jgi:thioester reductase-like protein
MMGAEEFTRFAIEKIVPVNGDLIIEGLGMSKEDRQMLTENCQAIINCAASVSFNEPL